LAVGEHVACQLTCVGPVRRSVSLQCGGRSLTECCCSQTGPQYCALVTAIPFSPDLAVVMFLPTNNYFTPALCFYYLYLPPFLSSSPFPSIVGYISVIVLVYSYLAAGCTRQKTSRILQHYHSSSLVLLI
jgi:hypothetical protein